MAGKKNVKIPKGEEPTELTLERCLELADATPDKPKGGRFGKKAAPAKEEKDTDAPAKKAVAAKKPAAKKATAAKKPATKAKAAAKKPTAKAK